MILCDMDGVITDFVRHALPLFGHEADEIVTEENMEVHLGITSNEFWSTIEKAGVDWWASMPQTKECDDIINTIEPLDQWCISTSPSQSADAIMGKIMWLKNKFGKRFNNYMIGKHKQLMSKPGNILVDDFDKNVEKFRNVKSPGHAILVPRPWNSYRNLLKKPLHKYIGEQIKVIKEYYETCDM